MERSLASLISALSSAICGCELAAPAPPTEAVPILSWFLAATACMSPEASPCCCPFVFSIVDICTRRLVCHWLSINDDDSVLATLKETPTHVCEAF